MSILLGLIRKNSIQNTPILCFFSREMLFLFLGLLNIQKITEEIDKKHHNI